MHHVLDYLRSLYRAAKLAPYYQNVAETNPGSLTYDALIWSLSMTHSVARGGTAHDEDRSLAA